jgi:cytochrome c-type biogenesis protein CcmH
MIAFWLIGAALAAVALFLALRPLLRVRAAAGVSRRETNLAIYRDQRRELEADLAAGKIAPEEHERARKELEMRVLEDVGAAAASAAPAGRSVRGLALAAGAAIPLVAVALYFIVGNPGTLGERQAPAHAVTAQQVESMVARLAARLRENPEDTEGWRLLGRSLTVLGRFPEAAEAYGNAAKRSPRDPQLLADLADALAMAQGRRLAGEPEQLVLRALEIDPNNLKALALAGSAAFERKDYNSAAAYWQRMLPLVPEGSDDARAIQANVNEALALLGKPPAPPPVAARHPGVRGTVRLAGALRKQASPDDTVYIFARAAEGPPMPLAVLKKRVRDLPASFALDDTMAMAPQLRLSAYPRVIVGARISKSGSATPQSGDLQGTSTAVANNAAGVSVVIDRAVP